MINPFLFLFRARDKPRDAVSAATTFSFGTSGSGKPVNAKNITSGTLDAARLPFKVKYGSTTVTGVSWTTVSLSGFTSKPIIVVSFANNAATSGINVLKT